MVQINLDGVYCLLYKNRFKQLHLLVQLHQLFTIDILTCLFDTILNYIMSYLGVFEKN